MGGAERPVITLFPLFRGKGHHLSSLLFHSEILSDCSSAFRPLSSLFRQVSRVPLFPEF